MSPTSKAAVHGQPLNASQLGASMALTHKTISSHIDFLEGAFLVRRLLPYGANIKKRLVKTPRLYWRDSGLLHALMRVADLEQLYRQPWLGRSWEGFVIEQTLATLSAADKRRAPYFLRTSDGTNWTWCSIGERSVGPSRSSHLESQFGDD